MASAAAGGRKDRSRSKLFACVGKRIKCTIQVRVELFLLCVLCRSLSLLPCNLFLLSSTTGKKKHTSDQSQDGRILHGTFLSYDRCLNLVIADAVELRPLDKKKAVAHDQANDSKSQYDERTLGLVCTLHTPPPQGDAAGATRIQ